jgi:hypothetical protein
VGDIGAILDRSFVAEEGEVEIFLFLPRLLSMSIQLRPAPSQFEQGVPFAAALHLTRRE